MKYIFAVLAVICYTLALFGCIKAKTSIHEVQGGIVVIVATLFAVAAGIIDSIQALAQKLVLRISPEPAPTPETHVRCPECRKLVNRDSRKCPHCNTDLKPEAPLPPIHASH